MPPTHDYKAVRLYRQGLSVKAIVCHLGCAKARVLRHLKLAGVELDPARESSHHGYVAPEHLIGVDGISVESAKFLAKQQPRTEEEEAAFDAEIREAVERVKPRSMAKRVQQEASSVLLSRAGASLVRNAERVVGSA